MTHNWLIDADGCRRGQVRSLMVAVLVALFIKALPVAPAELPEPTVRLIVAKHQVRLDAVTRRRVVSQIEAIVCSANFDSEHHPELFRTGAETNPPEQVLKASYLRITYPSARTFETLGGRLTAQIVDVALEDRETPGRFFLRDGKRVVRISKESGAECVRLARLPGLSEHLPSRIRDNLPKYDHIR